ncbi:acyltransferase family protein [Neptunicella sp.]|uniref:acyltransferase family protein n=1 Tax=Neptunicella sp. TaxID=2125986 RepID=UPI003F69019B
MSSLPSNRLDYLDAVRGFALILGIIFHASLSFMPMFIGWAVMDISTSNLIPFFALISHSFRMELFFLIAGFFSHMNFHKRGWHKLVESRLVRIAIPFIVGWFLFRPMLVSGWIMGAESMRGDANISGALVQGIKTLADIPKDLLVGTHLWFLYYLLFITASLLLIRCFVGRITPLQKRLTRLADWIISWICQTPVGMLVVAIPTAASLWFMQHWGMDTPDKSLVPTIPVTLIYAGFFLFGWLLHRQPRLLETFAQITWGKSLLCLIAIIASMLLSKFEGQLNHTRYDLIKVGFMFSYAMMMWTLIALTIGLCKRIFSRPNRFIRYMADASYWLYLVHLPIVVWLQIAFAELPLHWSLKLLGISTITIALSTVIYDAFVRSTWVGRILNGSRKPRLLVTKTTIVDG